MATEIDIKIKTADAAKDIKEIKKQIKELDNAALNIGEGGAGFAELTKKSAELRDKLDDLKDATQQLKGSGVEKLNSSFGLLKEGFANADPGKLGTAMKGLGMAMKAIPIFLIIEGIKYLVENFDKLKNSTGFVGKAFSAVGDVIGFVVDKVKEFTDFIGLTNFALEAATNSIIENNKKAKESTIERYDSQIAAAKREHKETVFLEIQKQQAILATNKMAIDALEERKKINGSLSEDDLKNLTDLRKQNSEAYRAISDSWASYKDAQLEKSKKASEEQKKINEKQYQEELVAAQKRADAENALIDAAEQKAKELHQKKKELVDEEQIRLAASEEEKLRILADRQIKELEMIYEHSKILGETTAQSDNDLAAAKLAIESKFMDDVNTLHTTKEEAEKKASDEAIKRAEAETEKKKQLKQQEFDQAIQGAQAVSSASQKITDLYFNQQLKSAKGNAKEELEIRKKQFKVNKAYGIVNATIDGIQGVAKALNNPYPLNLVLAAASAVAAAANVAAISSQQFTGDEGGGGSQVASAATGGGSLISTPQGPTTNSSGTTFNQDVVGQVQSAAGSGTGSATNANGTPQRVYVLESDITSTQNNIANIEESNTF